MMWWVKSFHMVMLQDKTLLTNIARCRTRAELVELAGLSDSAEEQEQEEQEQELVDWSDSAEEEQEEQEHVELASLSDNAEEEEKQEEKQEEQEPWRCRFGDCANSVSSCFRDAMFDMVASQHFNTLCFPVSMPSDLRRLVWEYSSFGSVVAAPLEQSIRDTVPRDCSLMDMFLEREKGCLCFLVNVMLRLGVRGGSDAFSNMMSSFVCQFKEIGVSMLCLMLICRTNDHLCKITRSVHKFEPVQDSLILAAIKSGLEESKLISQSILQSIPVGSLFTNKKRRLH